MDGRPDAVGLLYILSSLSAGHLTPPVVRWGQSLLLPQPLLPEVNRAEKGTLSTSKLQQLTVAGNTRAAVG
jgi:hypothetical protein